MFQVRYLIIGAIITDLQPRPVQENVIQQVWK